MQLSIILSFVSKHEIHNNIIEQKQMYGMHLF